MLKFEFQAKSDAALKEKFSRLGGAEADELAANVVRTLTVQILGDAQTNLKKNGTSVSGQLMNSGRVSQPKMSSKEISAEVKFASDHAWYVEFGRRAGKMPPVAAIAQWAKKRGIKIPAFVLARSIGRKGTKAQPFFYPAIQKNSNLLVDNFKKQYDDFINKVTR